MQEKIISADITVVVQGPIDPIYTYKTLSSIRKHLPDAEVILSTWEDSDISNLSYDILVLNELPPNVQQSRLKKKKVFNNLNRMILSTKSGIEKVSRKYTLKLRSDLFIEHTGFLDMFFHFPLRCDKYKLFENRIVASSIFTKLLTENNKNKLEIPFHLSDWWFFGLTEDVKKLLLSFDMVEEPEFSEYFDLPENENKKSIFEKYSWKFAPEQYIAYSCFSKYFDDIRMSDCSDFSDDINKKSQICFANNFVFLEYEQSGICNLKYPVSKSALLLGNEYLDLYAFYNFENEYIKYCDANYIHKKIPFVFIEPKKGYKILRFYKHIYKLMDSSFPIFTRLEHLFIGLPISFISLLPILPVIFIKKFIKKSA